MVYFCSASMAQDPIALDKTTGRDQAQPRNGSPELLRLTEGLRTHGQQGQRGRRRLQHGGVIVWKRKKTEDRVPFQLMRHHDVLGLNKILSHMREMNITMFESKALPGQPGLIVAEPRWDKYQNSLPRNNLPEGAATYLEQVLRWHGAKLFRWAAAE